MCAIAALVFDVGQNLLTDAPSRTRPMPHLAGARYVDTESYAFHGGCSSPHVGLQAVTAACDVAAEHGYVDGVNGRTVQVSTCRPRCRRRPACRSTSR